MSRSSFLDRERKRGHPAYRRSSKQESSLAKRGRGKLVPGSGSGAEKGDVKKYNGAFRIEAKTTSKNSFSVTKDMVKKIEAAALAHTELPAIIVEFLDQRGNPELEVAVVPVDVLDSLNVGLYIDGK